MQPGGAASLGNRKQLFGGEVSRLSVRALLFAGLEGHEGLPVLRKAMLVLIALKLLHQKVEEVSRLSVRALLFAGLEGHEGLPLPDATGTSAEHFGAKHGTSGSPRA